VTTFTKILRLIQLYIAKVRRSSLKWPGWWGGQDGGETR
jgi:hypothetical protein